MDNSVLCSKKWSCSVLYSYFHSVVLKFLSICRVWYNVTYVDMHGIYCMCREVMDTFDWEHFDLIFTPDW